MAEVKVEAKKQILVKSTIDYEPDCLQSPQWMTWIVGTKDDWDELIIRAQYYEWELSVFIGNAPIDAIYDLTKEHFLKSITIVEDPEEIKIFTKLFPNGLVNFKNVFILVREHMDREDKRFADSMKGIKPEGYRVNQYPSPPYYVSPTGMISSRESRITLEEYDATHLPDDLKMLLKQIEEDKKFSDFIFSRDDIPGITEEETEKTQALKQAFHDIQMIDLDETGPILQRIKSAREYQAKFKKRADIIKSFMREPYNPS